MVTGNKKYLWSADSIDGSISFVFNAEGVLLQYDTSEANMNSEQLKYFAEKLPRSLVDLKAFSAKVKGSILKEVTPEPVTFDLFWNRYNEKVRSSKKKALKIWNKMSPNEQSKAFMFIANYERSINDGIAKKYAETYLNAELWNN
ncbi:hypothetical protein ACFOWM_06140 [Ferruginibacter yonginensis]|uniref:Uncharacterized protein n=1 Tax=Ferruginibacter yonginensis TaxID=1310416 RepID=A0ABV8QQ79_9BACT